MLRPIAAGLLGLVVAFVLIAVIETAGHAVFPPPAGLDLSNPDAIARYIADMPAAQLAFVLAAYVIATLVGGALAAIVARTRPFLLAGIIGALVLMATIANFALIPHPLWFVVSAVIAIPAAAFAAGAVGAKVGRAK